MVAVSCSREAPVEVPQLVHHVIEGQAGVDSFEGKATLNPDNEKKVLWSPREKAGVFLSESTGYPYLFSSSNATASATVSFEGDLPGELEDYVMLYPYNSKALWAYPEVTTELPTVQEGKDGTFSEGTIILAGQSSTAEIACKHVCSGIRFQLTGSDISAVTLRGRSGEKIAGHFKFQFDNAGLPEITSESGGTVEEVVLTAPGGGVFSPGTWYYIVCLPTVFTSGFTLTATSATRGTGVFTYDKAVSFNRSLFRNKTALDGDMEWTSITPSVTNTCYGPSNTIWIKSGSSYDLDVEPRMILPGWRRSGIGFDAATSPDSYELLWKNAVISVSEVSSALRLSALKPGTELLAVKKGDSILWSFLIWVTDDSLDDHIDLVGRDFLFQWGRKDPLQSVAAHAPNLDAGSLAYSLANPEVIIDSGENVPDWYTDTPGASDGTLWNSAVKTVWDPCPQGYRVASVDEFSGVSSAGSCWTSSHSTDYYSFKGDGTSAVRSEARPVRCVKE